MKNKTKRTRKCPVTRLAVSRLYNVGNYEHVRYEITVDVPPGESAAAAMRDVSGILARMKPIRQPPCLDEFEKATKKEEHERSNWEKEHLAEWADRVAEYMGLKAHRLAAVEKLDDVGGARKEGGGRRSESGDDDCLF